MERMKNNKGSSSKKLTVKFLKLQLLIGVLLFLELKLCYGVNVTQEGIQGRSRDLSSTPSSSMSSKAGSRNGKQIYFPVLFYSYPYRLISPHALTYSVQGVSNPYNRLLPLYYQPNNNHQQLQSSSNYNYHYNYQVPLQMQLQLVDYRKYLDEFKETHYNKVPSGQSYLQSPKKETDFVTCHNRGKSGLCKPFTECFPMMEMEYGKDFMDSPIAEQLLLNTNVTSCSERGSGDQPFIYCPDAQKFFKSAYLSSGNSLNDYSVNLPAITQRPPHRKILSRQLIEERMCGHSKLLTNRPFVRALAHKGELKITGGVQALGPEEFPWMVGVFGKNKKLFCGASLITDQFLISAAHCFAMFSPADIPHLYVHLGDFNIRTTTDGPHVVRGIEKLIIHKNFKIQNYHNDIALIKLDKPVQFTDRIQPICLPEPTMNSLENRKVIVTGWGRKYRRGSLSDVLRKVEMPVWDHDECKRVYSTFAPGRLQDSNLCAGDGKKNKDACIGDSGGGAISYDGHKWVIQGIVSWGKGCGNFPGVYTRVDKHLMWITSNLNKFS